MPHPDVLEKLVSLAKRRGFVFQSSEIYGGTGSVWDYGPLGVELKNNVKARWWNAMEMQFFVEPGTDMEWFETWKAARLEWHRGLGLDADRLQFHQHGETELAHYARAAFDIEFDFGGTLGFQEIEGVHNRSDFDLSQHQQFSGKRLEYVDQANNKRYLPYVIETSVGADRVMLAVLVNAYREEAVPGEQEGRTVLRLHPALAPITAGVFPLTKKDGQPEMADRLAADLRKRFTVFYDDAGAIGRRYRRQDEAGTPFGITIDPESTKNDDVTIRFRDDLRQIRVSASKVGLVIADYLASDAPTAEAPKA